MEVIALMCMIVTSDGYGLDLFASPSYDAEVVGSVEAEEWVAFNLSDRSGLWAEVTDSEGETGWVETGYLECQSN